jgi:hypothetical protein
VNKPGAYAYLIVAAIVAFVLFIFGIALFSAGHVVGPILGILALIAAARIAWFLAKVTLRMIRNRADGVIAHWDKARLTSTEFIDGFGSNAARHPLAGLTADVDVSGVVTRTAAFGPSGHLHKRKYDDRRIYVAINGPQTAVVYNRKFTRTGERLARELAGKVNLAGRQASGTTLPAQAAAAATPAPSGYPNPPSGPAAGWYAEPSGAPGRRYWDGSRWTTQTAP